MVKLSNSLIGILNFATFFLSIPILGGGIWLATKADSICEKFLQYPVIALGVLLMLVSIAGFVGYSCKVTWMMWIYLFVMFVLIILLFCFTIFAFVVTNKGAGEALSNRGYKDYKLGDYSNWLQKRVEKSSNWRKIRSCLEDAKVCKSLEEDAVNDVAEQFYKRNLSPIQSGCCKPPTECNFTFVNATYWSPPASFATSNADCNTWNNTVDELCYNCNSCKAGVLANLKHDWRKIAVLNVIVLIALIVVYSIGCCALRNNKRDNRYPYKGYATDNQMSSLTIKDRRAAFYENYNGNLWTKQALSTMVRRHWELKKELKRGAEERVMERTEGYNIDQLRQNSWPDWMEISSLQSM